jgi:hypothetical protein
MERLLHQNALHLLEDEEVSATLPGHAVPRLDYVSTNKPVKQSKEEQKHIAKMD